MLDADETSIAFDRANPRASVEAGRASLPEGLRTAAMVFQLSAKAHLKATLRGHAWIRSHEIAS